jgi:hypothetical protein
MALSGCLPVYSRTMTPSASRFSTSAQLCPETPRASAWTDEWSRPVFRAPPLCIKPPIPDLRDFIAGTQERAGLPLAK